MWLCSTLALIAFIGYATSLWSAYATLVQHSMLSQRICMNNDCVQAWIECVSNALAIGKATSELLVAWATVGGIVIALLTYLTNEKNSALTNHISHYTTFQSYVINEIEKRNRISRASVDISLWYNLIFTNSRNGDMQISKNYLKIISEINSCIKESNQQAQTATDGAFRYKPHQERIKAALCKFGIDLTFQPKNDFYEIEGQMFSLITAVNKSFCHPTTLNNLESRHYI